MLGAIKTVISLGSAGSAGSAGSEVPRSAVPKIMHQSIPAVTIPPGIPRGFVRPYVPGAGILYNKVLPRGLGAGTT